MLTVPTPKIPMSPSELPQQRLVEVVELPARPNPFRFQVGYGGFPAEVLPKQGVPRSPRYLFQCEWAEGPGNGSVDAFYLHARKKHWLLWLRYLDENADPWRWRWVLIGYCQRDGVSEKTAAAHLLLEYWAKTASDRSTFETPFEWVNEEGFLKIADVQAVARALEHRWSRSGSRST